MFCIFYFFLWHFYYLIEMIVQIIWLISFCHSNPLFARANKKICTLCCVVVAARIWCWPFLMNVDQAKRKLYIYMYFQYFIKSIRINLFIRFETRKENIKKKNFKFFLWIKWKFMFSSYEFRLFFLGVFLILIFLNSWALKLTKCIEWPLSQIVHRVRVVTAARPKLINVPMYVIA